MIQAVLILGSLGLIIGIGLALASRIFYVYVDPMIEAVEAALPGANCGGCGLPGCSANAEAIVKGKASPGSCVAGGAELAETIAGILGVSVEAKEPDIAQPDCIYSLKDADTKFTYDGINDCRAAALFNGGMKVCTIGCLGLGTCVRACPFNALSMGPDGLPVVNPEKCTGCGTCERECPKHIIKLSSVTRRIIREYTTDDCTTPCQRACPAGINIREYIYQIKMGNYHRSVQIIKERNPFPSTIGRICPHPCEDACRRNAIDDSVAINNLKRFAADYEQQSGTRILPYTAPKTDKKIAIIGGGIQGLSVAFFTARLGHSPTILEATNQLGGLLRKAIARDRLPLSMLDWDINGIIDMGVAVEYEKTAGVDFSIPECLDAGYEAVFVGSGGWDSRLARGADKTVEQVIPNTYLLVDLVKQNASESVTLTGHVVISGSGDAAIKQAIQSMDKGAQSVTLFLNINQDIKKLDALTSKGITVIQNAAITRLIGENKNLTEIEYENLKTNEKLTIQADTLILSTGRFPELIFTKRSSEDEQSQDKPSLLWEAILPYKKPSNDNEVGLFSKNDVITDYNAAIKAIGGARRAAASIHMVLYGQPISLPENIVRSESDIQNVDHVERVSSSQRQIMAIRTPQELTQNPELEKGYTRETAKREADRCLRCGLICYAKDKVGEIPSEPIPLKKAA